MKKVKVWLLLAAVLAAILVGFNVIAFLLPFVHTAVYWIAYGLTTTAVVLAFLVSGFVVSSDSDCGFLGMPMAAVSWIYASIQIILGFAFMCFSKMALPAAIIVGLIPLLIYVIALTVGLSAKEHVSNSDHTIKAKRQFLENLTFEVNGMIAKTQDDGLRKALREVSDALRYADPMSSNQLAALEGKIELRVEMLGQALETPEAQQHCKEILKLISERNLKCRQMK